MKNITIKSEISQRVDKFLAQKYPQVTRNFIQQKIAEEKILVNDKPTTRSYKLRPGDQISLEEKDYLSQKSGAKIVLLPNPEVKPKIVFQNQHFAIIDKSVDLAVHPDNRPYTEPKQNTLVNGLLAQFPQIKDLGDDPLRPGIVHRLDKGTSGLMIVALDQQAFDFFKRKFKERKIKKTYLARVWGCPKENAGTIQTLIGKSKADLTKQSTSSSPAKLINPKKAITHWRLVKKFADSSLLEVNIETGRKHQIRVHLHSIGHPIVGDRKYQTKAVKELNRQFPRQLLHAYKLEFQYLDGKKYAFETKIPEAMTDDLG